MAGIWTSTNEFKELSKDATMLSQEMATYGNAAGVYRLSQVLPNPDYILRKAGKTVEVYNEVLADPRVNACATSRSAGVLSLEHEIVVNDSPDNVFKFITDIFNDLPVLDIMRTMLDAPLWGQSILEVVWQSWNGNIIPQKVVGKPNEWFIYDSDGALRMRTINNSFEGELLPDYKFLVAKHRPSYKNPYGDALLSLCFWPVIFKKGGIRFWVQFTERFGMPWVVGKAPSGSSVDKMNEFLAQIIGLRQGGATVIDENANLELVDAKGSASVDAFEKLIDYCNEEIAIALLGQNLSTQVDGGSYAAAQAHMEVRKDIIISDKRIVESTMNEFIKWVCLLNFGELDTYPQFQLWNDEQVDKTLAERDGILSRDCKVTFTPEYYVKAYGFVPEDIAKIGDDQSKPPVQFSEPQNPKSFAGQTAIDQYADTLSVQELQKQADGILKPVIDMINECNDFGECLDKLAKTFPSMDSLALQEMLSRAIFVSEYIGNAEAARE